MALDTSGVALGTLIAKALALPAPPTNPSPAQLATYNAAVAAQLATWTTVAQQILTYLVANTVVNTTVSTTDTIGPSGVATIVAPSGGGPCTGTASGTGTGTGNGTIS